MSPLSARRPQYFRDSPLWREAGNPNFRFQASTATSPEYIRSSPEYTPRQGIGNRPSLPYSKRISKVKTCICKIDLNNQELPDYKIGLTACMQEWLYIYFI